MPSSAREAFFALRAFNVEIASIKDASKLIGGRSRGGTSRSSGISGHSGLDGGSTSGSDPSLASRLRMQWWKDAILEIYDEKQQQQKQYSKNNDANRNNAHEQQRNQNNDSVISSLTSSRKLNPTLRSLSNAIHTHGLTYRFLRRIMEPRESDLDMIQYERLVDVA